MDPGEQEDLSDQMPELVQIMQVGQKQKNVLKKFSDQGLKETDSWVV